MTTHMLSKVKARDLMQTQLITLAPEATAKEAIETFEEYKIGGAPVVDQSGNLLGVLTISDIAREEHLVEGRLSTERSEYYLSSPLDDEDWASERELAYMEDYSSGTTGPDTVRDWMTPQIISVEPDASLRAVCQLMVKKSVHRLLVVEKGELKGILSTFDIVRHLAQAD